MLRISTTVSLCFTVLIIGGAVTACSSDSKDGGGGGGAGGSGGSTAAAGTSTASGGTGSIIGGGSGGVGGGRAGSSSTGGSGGTAGGGLCAKEGVVCVDANTASFCDPDTGMTETIDCATDLKEIGFDSTGCMGDAISGNCDGEPSDAECLAGAQTFEVCGGFTPEQVLNTYVNCFQNTEDLRTPIVCVGKYLGATEAETDCDAAAAECLPEEPGAGGAGG